MDLELAAIAAFVGLAGIDQGEDLELAATGLADIDQDLQLGAIASRERARVG